MAEKLAQITIVATYPINFDNYTEQEVEKGDYQGAIAVDKEAYDEGDVNVNDLLAFAEVEEVEFKVVDVEAVES